MIEVINRNMKKIVILIPTYNEKENIGEMIDVLENMIFPKINNYEMKILIADDNSKDGTIDIVSEKIKKYKNVVMTSGRKNGLGEAFLRGTKFAISQMHAEAIIKMDADFQHDPIYVLDLVSKYDEGNDYIVGSRYIKGGEVPSGWSIFRKLLSKYGGLFTRIILFFPHINIIKDVSSGLKLISVENVLNRIDLTKLSLGFCYTTQLMYYASKLKIKITEIPIKFKLRDRGETKMSFSNIPETLKTVFLLRFSGHKYIKSH